MEWLNVLDMIVCRDLIELEVVGCLKWVYGGVSSLNIYCLYELFYVDK